MRLTVAGEIDLELGRVGVEMVNFLESRCAEVSASLQSIKHLQHYNDAVDCTIMKSAHSKHNGVLGFLRDSQPVYKQLRRDLAKKDWRDM